MLFNDKMYMQFKLQILVLDRQRIIIYLLEITIWYVCLNWTGVRLCGEIVVDSVGWGSRLQNARTHAILYLLCYVVRCAVLLRQLYIFASDQNVNVDDTD